MALSRSRLVHLAPIAVAALLAAPAAGPALAQPRAVQVLVLAALLAAVGSLGLWTARRLLGEGAPRASLAVAAFTAANAWLLVPAYLLGTAGLLAPGIYLPTIALLYLGGALMAPARPPVPPREPGARPARPAARREAAVLGAAFLAVAIFDLGAIRDERYRAPDKWDDPSYHLSAVAVWRHHGDLRMIKFPYGDPATTFYPIGSDLTSWALLAPFGDSDVAARWAQLPFALATLLAIAAVARRLGVSRRGAAVAALLYAGLPRALPELALTAGNDHSTAFFTLAALDATLAVARRPGAGRAAYAGLAFGLLFGTKLIGLLFALPLLGLLAAAVAARGWTGRRARGAGLGGAAAGVAGELARIALVGGAVALAVGGYTYLRNAWSLGNPLFPLPVAGLLPGWEHATMAFRRGLPEFEIAVGEYLWSRKDLWGSYFRLTLLPAAVVAPFAAAAGLGLRGRALAAGRAGRVRRLEEDVVLALPLLYFGLFLYWMHDHRDIRYLLPAVALAAVAAAWLADGAGRRPAHAALARGGLALLVLWAVVVRLPGSDLKAVAAAAALIALVRLALAARPRWVRFRPALGRRPGMVALLAVAAVAALAWRAGEGVETYQERRLRDQAAAAVLEGLTGGRPATVAYFGMNRPYFFFGRRLQNRVEMVPITDMLDERWYDWGGTETFPFAGPRYRVWRRNLEALGVEYVVLELTGGHNPPRRWMRRHPGAFVRLYETPHVEIWKVLPG